MRYVDARLSEYKREQTYRFYVTKSLQLAPQNKYMQVSYDEILKRKPVPQKTGDEILADVMKGAGLSFGD